MNDSCKVYAAMILSSEQFFRQKVTEILHNDRSLFINLRIMILLLLLGLCFGTETRSDLSRSSSTPLCRPKETEDCKFENLSSHEERRIRRTPELLLRKEEW